MPTPTRALRSAIAALLVAIPWVVATSSFASTLPEADPTRATHVASLVPVMSRDPAAQRVLAKSLGWRSFQSRHGPWKALWNEATGTPHRAFGPSIPLVGFANDSASADRAVRDFIAGHPDQFGGPGIELENVSTGMHGRVWYVRYRQTVNGIPVLFSDWEFRVGTNGRLMMFGADPRRVPTDLVTAPRLPSPVARQAAHEGLAFNAATDRVDLSSKLAYVPLQRPDGTSDLRLAYDAVVAPARRGAGQRVLVDAVDGTNLWRHPMRADAVTGTVTAQIHPTTPYDALITRPLRWVTVNAVAGGTASTRTDTTGAYSVTPLVSPCTITSAFVGPYCNVQRIDGPNSSFSRAAVANGSAVNIAWTTTNSQDAERDAFYHVNLAHDWVKQIDSSFTAMDYSLTANVNWNDGTDCEAYWDQLTNSLNFWPVGECPNTATIPDLVWHEYSHMLDFQLYYAHGAALGVQNQDLSEGLSDAFTVLMGGEPLIGNGFNGPGTWIRDVRIGARYPEGLSPDSHNSGLILGGAMWDFRTATFQFAPLLARTLFQLAKYGLPDDLDSGLALSEFFIDLLVADDNDADLSNGTPNMPAINTAFSAHGIGMNYFLDVQHTALDDQPSAGPYPIHATIAYGGPIGGLASVKVFFTASGIPWNSRIMLPTGNPDEYGAEIPKEYGVVRYYVVATDTYGGTKVQPPGAPNISTFKFFGGPASTLLFDNMEAPDGWTVGYAPDIPVATSGTWIRAVPVVSQAQLGTNHTPSGTQCWVTGNAAVGDPPGMNDVDDGKTTLVTSTFNGTPAGIVYPTISYWRWYSNDVGDSPGEDPWRAYISNNNGSTWTRVENTASSSLGWERILFAIQEYVTPTSTMKMRFVAQDTLNPSVVEAGVDDWTLIGFPSTLDVSPAPRPVAEFMLQPAYPNPTGGTTQLRYTLAMAGRVELRVYDLEGRIVATLVDGDRPPGEHTASWNGRDAAGRRLAAGPYFVRLTRGTDVMSRAVVLLR